MKAGQTRLIALDVQTPRRTDETAQSGILASELLDFLAEIGRDLPTSHQRVHDQQAPVDSECDGNRRQHAEAEACSQRHAKRRNHGHHRNMDYDFTQPATRAGFHRVFESVGAKSCGLCHARTPPPVIRSTPSLLTHAAIRNARG
jgi:hypothetical protein